MHNWSEIWLPRLAAWVNLRHVLRCVHAMRHRHRPAHCFLSMGASLFSRTLANLDICAREIWAGKENVYQLEVKINSTITLYTAFYMFSRSVWRHLAPTIPLIHAVGTAGNSAYQASAGIVVFNAWRVLRWLYLLCYSGIFTGAFCHHQLRTAMSHLAHQGKPLLKKIYIESRKKNAL